MTTAAFNIGALVATMGLDTTQYQAGMASVQASAAAADAATKKAAMSMTASMNAAAVKMQATGKKMTRFMTLPILAFGVASTKVFADFESSMAKITGLVGVAKSQVEAWKKEVLALGPATGQGPDKLADALFFITSAGIRGAEAMEVLEMAAKAATAGLGEAKVVADLVTSAMNAYGKENLSAAMATDVLVAAVREGKAEAASLAGAMGMVLPIASEYGVTFNQVGAAFAAMTRTGTNARVAATQLKAILSSMASPALKAEDAMDKYGTSSATFRKTIEDEGLIQALLNLKTAVNGNKVAMAEIFPNIRALMGVLDLLGKNMEDNVAIFKALEDPTGALDAAFLSATNTIRFKFQKAFATLKTQAIAYGSTLSEFLIPVLEKATAFIAESTKRWMALSDQQKENKIRVIALAAAMGPLLQITGRLMKLLATPKGPYAAAIAGAIALTLVIRKLIMKHREEKEIYDAVASVNDRINSQYETQAARVAFLVGVIEDENISQMGRIEAIKELKSIMPGYNAELTEEGRLINHNTTAIANYLVELKEKIKLQVFEEEYIALVKKQTQAQRDLDKALTSNRIAKEAYVAAGMVEFKMVAKSLQSKQVKEYTKEYEALRKSQVELQQRKIDIDAVTQSQAELTAEMERTGLVLPGAGGEGGGPGGPSGGPGGDPDMDMLEKQAKARLDLARFIADEGLALYTNAFQKRAAAEQLAFERTKSALEKQVADGLLTKAEGDAGIEALERAHQVRMAQIIKDGVEASAKFAMKEEARRTAALKKEEDEAKRANDKIADDLARANVAKMAQVDAYFSAASTAINALSTMTTLSMQKELDQAGDNKKKREQIEAAYYKKQKKWAISQAIINGALAVTQAIANVEPPASYVLAAISAGMAAAEVATISATNFASGGVVYAETLARVAEYPGARANPEVISPLSDLRKMLNLDTPSGLPQTIILRAEGRDLVGVIDSELLFRQSY